MAQHRVPHTLHLLLLGGALFLSAGRLSAQETLSRLEAEKLVMTVVQAVETHRVPAKDQAASHGAKLRVLQFTESPGRVTPDELYGAINAYLRTLDTEGHTFAIPAEQWKRWESATPTILMDRSALAQLVEVGRDRILVLRLPQTTFVDEKSTAEFATWANGVIDGVTRGADVCGVVIDLAEQKGGNAWPAVAVLQPLLSAGNTARFAPWGKPRSPIWASEVTSQLHPRFVSLGSGALAQLRGLPFAVVTTGKTASAGEMVAVLLRGEARSRSFGRPTYGASTANIAISLPDGGMLALTVARYALGDGPPLKGRIEPDERSTFFAPHAWSVRKAAQWVQGASSRCKGGTP